jgi:hypothetical protein
MKTRLATTALCLAMLLAATTASAQMKFMNDGQSGFGLGAAYLDGEDFSGFGGTASYTVRGSWDLGLDVSWLSLDEETNGTNASATAVTPWFALGLVRPKEASKFGAELKVGYEMDSYSSDVFDELGVDFSSSALIGAASLYMRLESSPTMLIYPEVSLGYMTGTVTFEDADGTEEESDIDEVVYGASVSFLFNQKVRVTPAFMSVDDNSTWMLTVGLVLPGN